MLRLIVDKPQSLKEYTENNYAQGAFFWNVLLKNKDIKVNGKRVGSNIRLQTGDEVCYYLSPKQESKTAFLVAYEDENVLIVDKESGVNSEAVFASLLRLAQEKGEWCYFIHRLDRNTKGLMVFAKTQTAEAALLQAFKEKRAEKRYHALCFYPFKKQAEVLTAYLKKDAENSLVHVYDTPKPGAEKIITEYSVLEKISDEMVKVEVCLHTGKTHQIRAHLAHVGHPLVGDMKYGISEKNKALKISRQCLVAKKLSFSLNGALEYLNEKTWISSFDAELPTNQE